MDDLILEVAHRDVMRKKTRFLRRQGITPVHLFGHNVESLALQSDTAELQRIIAHAGMTRPISLKLGGDKHPKSVLIREIQRDPVNRQLLHVDFYQVRKGEKIKVDVPIVLVGEAPAVKTKGRMLTHSITSLSLECLPDRLPSQIEVDLSSLEEVGQAIHVRDIVLDPEITLITDPDQLVVKISEARVEKVEEVAEVAAEEEVEVEAEAEAPAEKESEQKPAD